MSSPRSRRPLLAFVAVLTLLTVFQGITSTIAAFPPVRPAASRATVASLDPPTILAHATTMSPSEAADLPHVTTPSQAPYQYDMAAHQALPLSPDKPSGPRPTVERSAPPTPS